MRTKAQIATYNDLFRSTMIEGGRHKVVLTPLVAESPDREDIITEVRNFKGWHNGNDPHKEHDFGAVHIRTQTYFFKCDYYTPDFQYGADPHVDDYAIVLTIMHSSEY